MGRSVAVATLIATTACAEPDPAGTSSGARLFEVLGPVDTIRLSEDSLDPIGDIGILLEARNGDLVVADVITPRVLRFDPNGRLRTTFGRYGEGAFEFRRIGGLAEDQRGRIIVVDPSLGRATILSEELTFDTVLAVRPRPRGPIQSVGRAAVFVSASGSRSSSLTLMDENWTVRWTAPLPDRIEAIRHPYWRSYGSVEMAGSSGLLVVAYTLLYPFYVYDVATGSVRDSLPDPPSSFRPVPVVEAGAFTGVGADKRRQSWLSSFDVIGDLALIGDTLLAVTRASLRTTQTRRFERVHQVVDLYHLGSALTLIEGLRLPEGARVLAGGTSLYILVDQPPREWTIVRVRVSEVPPR